jgi:hypothetical protein
MRSEMSCLFDLGRFAPKDLSDSSGYVKRGGMIEMTPELLVSLLRLPHGTVLAGIHVPAGDTDIVRLKVRHEGLPVVPEGNPYPAVKLRETEHGLEFLKEIVEPIQIDR